MYERGMVQVSVTRLDGIQGMAPMQNLILDSDAVNLSYGDGRTDKNEWFNINMQKCQQDGHPYCNSILYYDMVHTAPLKGVAYPHTLINVPGLKAGQNIVIPVVFNARPFDYKPPDTIYQPRANAIQNKYPGVDMSGVQWGKDLHDLTGSGATVTISAAMLCKDQTKDDLFINVFTVPCSQNSVLQFNVP